MTYLDAAIAVLKASGKPMTVADITETALDQRLIRTHGKTPVASMSAALHVYTRNADTPEIRREFRPGGTRAARDSVRWLYVGRELSRQAGAHVDQ